MKTKYWILLFLLLALVLGGLTLLLHGGGRAAGYAEVYLDGQLYRTVPLAVGQSFTVESARGSNTVTVKDGKIAVTHASCPDQYCVQRGFQNSGAPIICLPNRLVIRFTDTTLDAQSG